MSDRAEIIRAGIRRRKEHRDPTTMRGLDHVAIRVVDGLSYEAVARGEADGRMRVGEPIDRGGDGTGASPIAHFLTGAGACLLNQFVRLAIADDLPVAFSEASVRGEFGRDPGGAFQRISVEVVGSGELADDAARQLLERAELFCYVHQTLRHAVEMTTVLVLDGRERARSTGGPVNRAP